jgi:ABC-type uncharacterized transport system substrate-binding protein
MSVLGRELIGKQLQLLKETVPGIARVAVLANPTVPHNAIGLKEAEAAARSMNVQIQPLQVRAPGDFVAAFSAMKKDRVAKRADSSYKAGLAAGVGQGEESELLAAKGVEVRR